MSEDLQVGQELFYKFIKTTVKSPTGEIGLDAFGHRIATGEDSVVFKQSIDGEDYVFKFYNQKPILREFEKGRELIELYENVTNAIAESPSTTVTVGERQLQVAFTVNPIDAVVWSDIYNCWISISKFVEGRELKDYGYFESDEVSTISKQLLTLSNKFNHICGTEGIKISEINCLYNIDSQNNSATVTIVDLCASLQILKKV